MNAVDVVIPSLGKPHAFEALVSLQWLPFPIRLHVMREQTSWPAAVNAGLARSTGDVLLMDDDARVLPETFSGFEDIYPHADVFGFKLLYPDGRIQHAGGFVRGRQVGHLGYGQPANTPAFNEPSYVCHLTTSFIYLKRAVVEKLGGMATDYPGMQFEDVDFNFRALKAGFRLLYVPRPAIHLESASKKTLPGFQIGFNQNYHELVRRHLMDLPFVGELMSYPKPLAKELV